jgi:hypothetical protein
MRVRGRIARDERLLTRSWHAHDSGGGYLFFDGDNSADDPNGKPRPPVMYTIQQVDWQARYEKLHAAVAAVAAAAVWSGYNVFDATEHYGAALQRIVKAIGITPPSPAIATGLFSQSVPNGTHKKLIAAEPVLRVLNAAGISASEAEQLRLAEADLVEAQQLAMKLAERLQSFSIHALNANETANNIDIPNSLEMVTDLADLVRDYVAEPYVELCECGAPLMEKKCPICGEHMCTGNELYGIAPVSFGKDCGRTAATWRVKDAQDMDAEVCSRHTDEEASAHGLEYFEDYYTF